MDAVIQLGAIVARLPEPRAVPPPARNGNGYPDSGGHVPLRQGTS